jgi:cytidine deaminase
MDEATLKTLIDAARHARTLSYSPYSRFRVGAALLCEDGTIMEGTNVENAAYTPSICAERSAVAAAVSSGRQRFEAIAIVAHDTEPIAPCGVCRQTLAEFNPEIVVILASEHGDHLEVSLAELLPMRFDPSHLGR